ncbi:MAG: hypothetical protein ACK5ML_09440 [Lachnospiraceae bacterium]
MKGTELSQLLNKLYKETQEGKVSWDIHIQTTEGNEEKFEVEEQGKTWQVDECYVSYSCTSQGREVCMITYEMIKKNEDDMQSINYVFVPPLGIRLFSVQTLLPYSVETDRMLIHQVHNLWELIVELHRKNSPQIHWRLSEAEVVIEDESDSVN